MTKTSRQKTEITWKRKKLLKRNENYFSSFEGLSFERTNILEGEGLTLTLQKNTKPCGTFPNNLVLTIPLLLMTKITLIISLIKHSLCIVPENSRKSLFDFRYSFLCYTCSVFCMHYTIVLVLSRL